MGMVTVRVVPRAGRTGVEPGPEGPVVRVRAAPHDGRATAEAARAVARAVGVPATAVRLVRGGRSRVKTFDVEEVPSEELLNRIQGPDLPFRG